MIYQRGPGSVCTGSLERGENLRAFAYEGQGFFHPWCVTPDHRLFEIFRGLGVTVQQWWLGPHCLAAHAIASALGFHFSV